MEGKMMDAISRSAVLEELYKFQLSDDCMEHEWAIQAEDDVAKYTLKAIKNAPALDVATVVHARWIYSGELDEDGNCEANCSHCGAWDKHRADLKDAVPFCWKCGARMDGETE